MTPNIAFFLLFLLGSGALAVYPQTNRSTDYEIAARFAPVFYQALGDKPRSDYITNFDFDGDWRGDNNWDHTDDKRFRLKGYIYYSVVKTATHYFIHYAVFHPRDYKGGEETGRFLSELIRKGAQAIGDKDPTGMLDKVAIAHENDMEGALVVVARGGDSLDEGKVAYVETVAHNSFPKYTASEERRGANGMIRLDDGRPMLYVEPKGHGMTAYNDQEETHLRSRFLMYRYTGKPGDPEAEGDGPIGYELVAIKDTLWPKALGLGVKKGPTYGDSHNYPPISLSLSLTGSTPTERKVNVGGLGSAFFGTKGGENIARPPWGWFDANRRDDPLGLWFFDPATVIKRDFDLGKDFSTAYTALPFWATKTAKVTSRP